MSIKRHKLTRLPFIALGLALILAAAIIVPLTANADTSGDWEYTVSGSNATITKYKGNAADVVVPSVLDGYTVTSVSIRTPSNGAEGAFYDNQTIESVTIPEGITQIGDFAFFNCFNLTNVSIPASVTSIGTSSFRECSRRPRQRSFPVQSRNA